MAVKLPNKSIISIASTYEAADLITALSNAAEAVATLEASHGIILNDILEVNSGWSLLSGRIVRAGAVDVNDVTFEDIDTSSLINYPAGSGIGNLRKISAWTQIAQVTNSESSGGDPQYATYSFLEDPVERQIPTGKSARSLTLTLADDPALPWYAVARAADADAVPRAIRVQLPGGGVIYYNAYVTFNDEPTLSKGSIMEVRLILSLVAANTRY